MGKAVSSKKVTPLFVLSLAVIAGCGGSGSESGTDMAQGSGAGVTTHATAITKVQFIEKADAICEAARERASEEFQNYLKSNTVPSSGPGMVAKAHDVVDTILVPALELQVKKIGGLGAPRQDVAEVNEILAAMQQGVKRAEEEPLEFIQNGTAMNQASKLAKAYGLTGCGGGNA